MGLKEEEMKKRSCEKMSMAEEEEATDELENPEMKKKSCEKMSMAEEEEAYTDSEMKKRSCEKMSMAEEEEATDELENPESLYPYSYGTTSFGKKKRKKKKKKEKQKDEVNDRPYNWVYAKSVYDVDSKENRLDFVFVDESVGPEVEAEIGDMCLLDKIVPVRVRGPVFEVGSVAEMNDLLVSLGPRDTRRHFLISKGAPEIHEMAMFLSEGEGYGITI